MSNQLVIVKNPFDRHERDIVALPTGERTVSSLVGEYIPAGVEVDVSINGHVLKRDAWATHDLVAGEEMLIVPHVTGEDFNPLAAVLMIAVMVAAPYLAAAIGPSLGIAAGTIGMTALTAGISLAGSMVVGALMAPSAQALPGSAAGMGIGSYDTSPAYSWNPATVQQSGGPIARAYGTTKLYGNIISGRIEATEADGKDQTAHALVDLGTGPYYAINPEYIKLNDQSLNSFHGVTVVTKRGYLDTPNQVVIDGVNPDAANFSDTYTTHVIGTKILSTDAPTVRSTVGSQFQSLEAVITFPKGLWHVTSTGGMDPVSIVYTVEVKQSAGVWDVDPSDQYFVTRGASTLSAIPAGSWTAGYWYEDQGGKWGNPDEAAVGNSPASTNYLDHDEGSIANYRSKWRWIGSGGAATYTTVVNSETVTSNNTKAIRRTHRIDGITPGTTCQVRVINYSATHALSTWGDDMYLSELNEILLDDFIYPRTVLAGIKALATDQLSGSLRFSCIADAAIIRVYPSATTVPTTWATWAICDTKPAYSVHSSNPAWIAWDILTQPVLNDDLTVNRYDGLDPSRLNLASFHAWAAWCDEDAIDGQGGTEVRCRWDGVFDTVTDAWSAALEVCASARATLVMQGTTVYAVWDRPRTDTGFVSGTLVPTQLFTVGNSSQFSETFLPLADRASTIEVSYVDSSADYQRDTVSLTNVVVAATSSNTSPATVAMRGVTRATQAWREAAYLLAKNQYLIRTAELSVDIDAIACTVGDLILVQSDTPQWGEGGRAVSGTTTSIVLDHPITLAAGTNEIVIRLADDTLATRTITTGAGTVSSVAWASALSSAVAQYDVWAIGAASAATKPFLVTGLKRDGDQRVRLSLIEYNASIYLTDLGIAAQATPNVSASKGFDTLLLTNPNPTIDDGTGLPVTEGDNPSEHMVLSPEGKIETWIDIAWWFTDRSKTRATQIMYKKVGGGPWTYQRELGDSCSLGPVEDGEQYIIWLACENYLGQVQPNTTTQRFLYTPVGKTALPADVVGFAKTIIPTGFTVTWTANTEVDLLGYEIRFGASWAAGTVLVTEYAGTSMHVPPIQAGTTRYLWIKAMDTGRRYSDTAASVALDPAALAAPTIAKTAGVKDIAIKASSAVNEAYGGLQVWVDTTPGFAPGAGNLKYSGKALTPTITGLSANTTYYFQTAFVDWLDNVGPYSVEDSVTTQFLPPDAVGDSTAAALTKLSNLQQNLGDITTGNIVSTVLDTGINYSLWINETATNTDVLAAGATAAGKGAANFRVTRAGVLYATGAVISGAISGSTIDIGGDDATSFHVDIDGNLWSGASVANKATAPFRVSNAGAVTATSAAITGDITADTGRLGGANGWTIVSGRIYGAGTGGTIETVSTATTGIKISNTGIKGYGTSPTQTVEINTDGSGWFGLTGTRAISWTAAGVATVGGFTTTATALYSGSKTAYNDGLAGVHVSSAGIGLNNTFSVSAAGVLTATSGYIGGATNGWQIAAGTLSAIGTGIVQTSVTASTGIKLDSTSLRGYNGTVQTVNIATDGSGWFGVTGTRAISWTTAGVATIGGFTATAAAFYSGSKAAYDDANAGVHISSTGIGLGANSPFKVSAAGVITAISGTVGGWTLAATTLTGGNATLAASGNLTLGTTNDVVRLSADDATYRLWSGHATAASAPFRVTKAGAVTATSGTIGGFTLSTTQLYAGTGATRIMLDTAAGINLGHDTFASAPFSVTLAGVLKATSGTVGGWTLAATTLTGTNAVLTNTGNAAFGTTNDIVRLSADDATYRIWVGNATAASAPFSVTKAGAIYATSGTVGGNTLSATSIGSTTFVSGPLGSGWNISNTGTAEFQNATIRGVIRTSVFEKDTISAVNGIVLVSKADVLSADMTALDASTLTISGESSFVANEVIRLKDGTSDEWLLVTSAAGAPTYTVTRDLAGSYGANANPIWKKGTAVVSMGVGAGTTTGYITLDSSSTYAPFIDVWKRNSTTYTDVSHKVRLGSLDGITDATVGLAAGNGLWGLYSDNVYLKGTIVASGGTIGGWSITSTYLVKDTGVAGTSSGMAPSDYPFYAGSTYANRATAPFRVTPAGLLTATGATISGAISGSTIDIGGADATSFHVDVDGNIWSGAAAYADAPFKVSNAGQAYADSVRVAGTQLFTRTSAGSVFDATSGGLNYQYGNFANTGSDFIIGIESNTAGGLVPGSTAYAGFLVTRSNTPVHIGVNNMVVASFTANGLNATTIGASTPAAGTFTTVTATNIGGFALTGGITSATNQAINIGSGALTAGAIVGTSATIATIYGSSAANGDITIEGTSSATKTTSYVILQSTGGNVGIGTTAPANKLHVSASVNNDYAAYIFNGGGDGHGLLIKSGDASGNFPILNAVDGSDNSRLWVANGGNVGIGTTSPGATLDVSGADTFIRVTTDNTGGYPGIMARHSQGTVGSPTATLANNVVGAFTGQGYGTTGYKSVGRITINANGTLSDTDSSGYISFLTTSTSSVTPTEKMRITSQGAVTIPGTLTAGAISGTTATFSSGGSHAFGIAAAASVGIRTLLSPTGAATEYGMLLDTLGDSTGTTALYGVYAGVRTPAAAYTATTLAAFYAVNAVKGAGSTITNAIGYYAQNQNQGSTLNIGFQSAVTAASGSWNFYASGTASNAFAGSLRIGSVVAPTVALDVTGAALISGTLGVTGITTLSNDVKIAATKKLYLDGGTHTYWAETAGDIVSLYVGAAQMMEISTLSVALLSGFSSNGDLSLVGANASIYAGSATSYGLFGNDTLSAYLKIYGHSHASAGTAEIVAALQCIKPAYGDVLTITTTGVSPTPGYFYSASADCGFYAGAGATDAGFALNSGSWARIYSPNQSVTFMVDNTGLYGNQLTGGATTLSVDASGYIIRTPSDERFKTHTEEVTDGIDIVRRVPAISYEFCCGMGYTMGAGRHIGWSAQAVRAALPTATGLVSADRYGKLSLNEPKMSALLWSATRNVDARLARAEEKLAAFAWPTQLDDLSDWPQPLTGPELPSKAPRKDIGALLDYVEGEAKPNIAALLARMDTLEAEVAALRAGTL